MGREQRTKRFINKQFQIKFILRFCSLVVLGAGITSIMVFLYLFYEGSITVAFSGSRLQILSTADHLLPVMILVSLVSIAIIGLGTVLTAIYFSHRIAGPLYRLERVFNRVGEGDLTVRVMFRTGDELQSAADSANAMIAGLNDSISEVKARVSRLGELLAELADARSGDEGLRRDLQALVEERDALMEDLDVFFTETGRDAPPPEPRRKARREKPA